MAGEATTAHDDWLDLGLALYTPAWYAVHTEPGEEGVVRAGIEELGFEVYVPLCRPEKSKEPRPLVSGYVFPRFKLTQPWSEICALQGVECILWIAGDPDRRPHPIAESFVRRLKDYEGEDGVIEVESARPKSPLKPGDLVRVEDWDEYHPIGVVVGEPNRKGRIRIEFEFFNGRPTTSVVHVDRLRRVRRPVDIERKSA